MNMPKIISGFFLIAIVFALAFVAFSGYRNEELGPIQTTGEPSIHEPASVGYKITHLGRDYRIVSEYADPSRISLYPNFEDKKTAKNLMEEYDCHMLINGGFYSSEDGENSPLGLFVSEGKVISKYRENKTHNGVFYIKNNQDPIVSRQTPSAGIFTAVQTGPVLIENNEEVELSLSKDKNARRMVAATTAENGLIFIAVYEEGTAFSGPRLIDLPQIVSKFSAENNISIKDAINLDGGSASAFYVKSGAFGEEVALSEASPLGSFFCAK